MTSTPSPTRADDALSDSERRANQPHPENFKEAETDEKVVEVLPIDGDGGAIQGIDPGQ